MLMVGNAVATAFGGLLALSIAGIHSSNGYKPWRWIFIIEGCMTAGVTILVYPFMSDWPHTAKWLSATEKAVLVDRIRQQGIIGRMDTLNSKTIKRIVFDWKIYVVVAIFAPSIIKQLDPTASARHTQALVIPIFVAATAGCLAAAYASDKLKHRSGFAIFGYVLIIIGASILANQKHMSKNVKYGALYFMAVGGYISLPMLWTLLVNNISGSYKIGYAIAMEVGLGNFGGIASALPLNIAIIGGGIGGVILGIALSKYPHITFTIYEWRSAFGEIGAGLGFGANSHLAMKLISPAIWESYQTRASFNGWAEKENVWFKFLVGEKGPNEDKTICEVKMKDEMTQSTVHRAHFLEELVKLLPEGRARFNKNLVGVNQTGEKVICEFGDGSKIECDAVVGCDGIRSGCRPFVFDEGKLVMPNFTQKVAYRGLVPMKIAEAALGAEKANNRHMYLGHGAHVLTFPVGKGAMMNVVAFSDSQKETWEGEWVQLIQGPDVWAIFEHPQVTTFHKDRLCLLGDAAHATSSHFGQGAGMALEDAYVLSNLLGQCKTTADLVPAFDGYDSVRVPRALKVISMSHEQGKTLDMDGEGSGDDLEKIAARLETEVRWIWDEDLERHLATAIANFEQKRP
ncbi:putative salicylate hydroxylase [Amylocarpus encephaloides]|uniref:Salicylate hydroxylase n=1 Tax=Amylocarpus encephaloides TaxID=45428 RepID=A0A9P8C0K9_9HELO|nr:putative salicylate hydroxylase [Amylocarpus encephaloides]